MSKVVDFLGSQDALASLPRLGEFAHLERLLLDHTPITDAELVNLKELAKLTFLSLDETSVSDAGLEHLQGLIRLKSLRRLQHKGHRCRAEAPARTDRP